MATYSSRRSTTRSGGNTSRSVAQTSDLARVHPAAQSVMRRAYAKRGESQLQSRTWQTPGTHRFRVGLTGHASVLSADVGAARGRSHRLAGLSSFNTLR